MVGDILNLIAHSIMEIKFYITFISNTFLIRLTVYEILRVFVCVCLCFSLGPILKKGNSKLGYEF